MMSLFVFSELSDDVMAVRSFVVKRCVCARKNKCVCIHGQEKTRFRKRAICSSKKGAIGLRVFDVLGDFMQNYSRQWGKLPNLLLGLSTFVNSLPRCPILPKLEKREIGQVDETFEVTCAKYELMNRMITF